MRPFRHFGDFPTPLARQDLKFRSPSLAVKSLKTGKLMRFQRVSPGGGTGPVIPENVMSQRCVEILLGRILTDDGFRQLFFPVGPRSFELAAAQGLELTPVERSALSTMRPRYFDCLARSLDRRILRSSASETERADRETAEIKRGS